MTDDEKKEKQRAYQRAYRAAHPNYQREYRAAHPDMYKQAYARNPERQRKLSAANRARDPIRWMLYIAKSRSKKVGVPFDISADDIQKPTHCPVFGMELKYAAGTGVGGSKPDNTASLDRIVPALGYVKGNVEVISWRANNLKSNATPDELKALSDYYNRK